MCMLGASFYRSALHGLLQSYIAVGTVTDGLLAPLAYCIAAAASAIHTLPCGPARPGEEQQALVGSFF